MNNHNEPSEKRKNDTPTSRNGRIDSVITASLIQALAIIVAAIIALFPTNGLDGPYEPIIVSVVEVVFQSDNPEIPLSPTGVSTPVSISADDSTRCRELISDDAIPSGSSYELTVKAEQVHIWTSGDFCVGHDGNEVHCEIADTSRGFVSIFYPESNRDTLYQLTNLVPGNNWHGVYKNCTTQELQGWFDSKIRAMESSPNCPTLLGCQTVEVLTFRGSSVTR